MSIEQKCALFVTAAFALVALHMAAQGGSPGIVISQVYDGGGNSGATLRNDLIELFNRGNQAVTVTGWSVQYAAARGVSWSPTLLNGVIQPGQYYLIQEAQGNGGSVSLPTPDLSDNINLSATDGKIALVSNAGALSGAVPTGSQIIDFVGYGAANAAEGSPVPALNNTTAAIRLSGGCTDTNNNQANFMSGPPAPRDSPSPLNLCSSAVGAPGVVSINPVVSTGPAGFYTFQFSDYRGLADFGVVNVLFNNFLDGRQACYLAYSVPNNVLYLVPDVGSGLLPGLVLNGSSSTVNRQCTVLGACSFASGSGNTLTLTLNLNFNAAFAGNKVVYMAAGDAATNSGWQTMGVLAVPPLPSTFPNPIGMSPPSGNGLTSTITFMYQDQSSATNLQTVWALINTAIDGRAACYIAYYRPINQVYLYHGDGSQATSIVSTGSNTIGNSQCTISAQGSTVQVTGNTLTVTLQIAFKTSFAGFKGVWLADQTLGGAQTSVWQALGAWNVPGN